MPSKNVVRLSSMTVANEIRSFVSSLYEHTQKLKIGDYVYCHEPYAICGLRRVTGFKPWLIFLQQTILSEEAVISIHFGPGVEATGISSYDVKCFDYQDLDEAGVLSGMLQSHLRGMLRTEWKGARVKFGVSCVLRL